MRHVEHRDELSPVPVHKGFLTSSDHPFLKVGPRLELSVSNSLHLAGQEGSSNINMRCTPCSLSTNDSVLALG